MLFNWEHAVFETELVLDIPLPCDSWSFTQGVACEAETLRQLTLSDQPNSRKKVTHQCAWLISILTIRRKVIKYVFSSLKLQFLITIFKLYSNC